MSSATTDNKPNEWNSSRSMRRFPESNNATNANSPIKSESSSNPNKSNQDCESDRNIQNLLSSTLMKTNLRLSDSDSSSSSTTCRISRTPDSSSNTLHEDLSFNSVANSINSQFKIAPPKPPKPNFSQHSKLISQKAIFDFPDSIREEVNVPLVIEKGDYLLKDQWNSFIGAEDLKKYPRRAIERNDNIWEMVSLHYGCLKRLVVLRDVYAKDYPYLEEGTNQITRSSSASRTESLVSERHGSMTDRSSNLFESIESLVPGLDPLIKCFATITDNLVNNHLMRIDRVITDIGRVLNDSINDSMCSELAKLYGHFNFQRQNSAKKLMYFKKYPTFLSYIHKCEKDPRSEKKTLSDYIQDISMFWARMTVPLNLIIDKTMNDSQEVNYLQKYKTKIQNLITEAENIQGKFVNSQVLKTIIENYEIIPECKDSEQVFEYMTSENATLIYKGEVQCEVKKNSNMKTLCRELTGVALETCLFFLLSNQEPGKNSCKYQLFQEMKDFPALLEWGTLYGYFREDDTKNTNSFGFYVIIEKPGPSGPSMRRFFVSTTTERNCWKNCMIQGFSRWQNENSNIKDAEEKLNEDLRKINLKWFNSRHGIELIKNLDHSLKVQFEYRTVGFRCILEEELKRLSTSARNSTTSTNTVTDGETKKDQMDGNNASLETYIPDLSNREGINDWLDVFIEWVNRLKFSLCSSGANITRSASEIESRKRPSIQTVKKCETFTSHDSPTYEKRPTDVTFLNPPTPKQKKDQRRISVTGFTNLFRINSKSAKHEDTDKPSTDSYSIMESTNDKDISDLSNFDTDNEGDNFMSGLSKDTVTAFNEINIAAKNITMELIELRTQKITYETEIRKLNEENQVYKEFYKKVQKSATENQGGLSTGNSVYQKSDSIHSPIVWNTNVAAITDIMVESTESFGENSTSFVNQNSQMAECRRQTEYLRQRYEQFANEKKKWEKEYDAQRLKIEKEKDSIVEKNLEIKKEKENLLERENKYKEKCRELQDIIDKHVQVYGIQFEEKVDLTSLQNNKIKQLGDSFHSRSHSDDTTQNTSHKRSSQSPISPPLASTESTSYSVEFKPTQSESTPIPDQLRGSLINQERQSLKTNSSDNILDGRSKNSHSTFSPHKSKMTPSIERKDLYANNNICFDNEEEKEWSSDIDDFTYQQRKNIASSNKPSSKIDEKSPLNESNQPIGNRASSLYNNAPTSLGLPLGLATKSKVKKDSKTRKIFKKI